MKIIIAPDPLLRQVCEPCTPGDKSLAKLAKSMAKDMYKNDGCGIAAPQVGVLKRLIVIDCDQDETGKKNPITLINPEVLETSGELVESGEGCLSCPGVLVPVTRPEYAKVKYFDLNGEEQIIAGDGLLGRCLQHEIDHLNGITLFESCKPIDRIKALREYDIALASGAKPGQTSVDEHERRRR